MIHSKRIARRSCHPKQFSSRAEHGLFIAGVFVVVGFIGIIGMQASNAATPTAISEAEVATLAGNASKAADPGASGGQAVKFGAAILAPLASPAYIKAIAGGNNIALVWSAGIGKNIQSYEIYRNGVKVAMVMPNPSAPVDAEKQGRRYIDSAVTRGQTYSYQIKSIGPNGQSSGLSKAVSARHPTNTTPIPSVSFDYSRSPAPNDRVNVETVFKRELEIWYPKVSDALAFPAYTPDTSIVFASDLATRTMATANGIIFFNPDVVNAGNLPRMAESTLIHESTHIVNAFGPGERPPWSVEGLGDWSRDWLIPVRPFQLVSPANTYSQLTEPFGEPLAAAFLAFMDQRYTPTFTRDISIAIHNANYTSSFFKSKTGKTEVELFEEFRFSRIGGSGPITGISSKCIDIANSAVTNGTKIQLSTCNSTNAQHWALLFNDPTDKNPANGGVFYINNYKLGSSKCLDVAFSGTANGTKTHLWDCNYGLAQQWTSGPNNSLINPNSGKCLATTAGGNEDGNQLIISDCDGSVGQRWTLPQ